MPLAANSEHSKFKRLRLAIACLFLLSVVVLPLPVLSSNIHLDSDTEVATAGYFRLSWWLDAMVEKDNIEYQLQRSGQPDFARFKVAYLGPDLARVVSGKSDGEYYYRIRAIQHGVPLTGWSNVVRISVAHHSLFRALMFFVAGAMVFFSLLIFILKQNKRG